MRRGEEKMTTVDPCTGTDYREKDQQVGESCRGERLLLSLHQAAPGLKGEGENAQRRQKRGTGLSF